MQSSKAFVVTHEQHEHQWYHHTHTPTHIQNTNIQRQWSVSLLLEALIHINTHAHIHHCFRSSGSPYSGSGQSSPGGTFSPPPGGQQQPGVGESISNLQLVWEVRFLSGIEVSRSEECMLLLCSRFWVTQRRRNRKQTHSHPNLTLTSQPKVVHNPQFSLGSGEAESGWARACLPEEEQQKLVCVIVCVVCCCVTSVTTDVAAVCLSPSFFFFLICSLTCLSLCTAYPAGRGSKTLRRCSNCLFSLLNSHSQHVLISAQPTLLDEDLEREGVDAAIAVVKARATAIAETAFWDHVTERFKAGLKVSLIIKKSCRENE